ncbi:Rhs element Vgr protein [Pseudoroseomonas deserti]|uniref:Rhs element Vgr protein n=1 Tax=Teichococcus deserti TaxID=1817963 RepID=A0A1V2H8G8_9PROT|nr:phage baseplate assembly protein V [Pseudoroseomonas deserti]ONG58589.1 Rhs element Vgr protein [Pseudoroseomonas deserti]
MAFQDIRRIIREELRALRLAELAVVQEVHPHAAEGDQDNYACTVRLRDDDMVLARVPLATARIGLAAIPDVGDLVLVQFLGGDVNAPLITASFYNDEDRPPLNQAGEAVLVLPPDAGEGEGVHLTLQSKEAPRTLLTLGGALEVTLQDDDPVVRIAVAGKAEVSIASDGAVLVKSSTGITLEGGELSMKGSKVTIEAQGQLVLKGATIDLN